jgi:peptidoglycan/xylan/chitin deacetylase (PgdA/CDA1 family)
MQHPPAVIDSGHEAKTLPAPRRRQNSAALTRRYVASGLAGVAVLPALAVARAPVHATPFQCAIAVVIALFAFAVGALLARVRVLAVLGVLGAGTAAWLLAQASYPVAAWLIAPALGFGAGLVARGSLIADVSNAHATKMDDRRSATAGRALALGAALLVALALVGLRAGLGRDAAMAAGALYVALAATLGLAGPASTGSRRWPAAGVAGLAVVALLLPFGTASYIGATTPRVTWFGALTSHGPRSSNQVALTFDDGPNPPYSLQIAQILDQHGAKGTFFTVGKALVQRPDVSRALIADGQLLGDHSYTHDAVHWLDPHYRELQQTQDAFQQNLGVCPAFYRPPHGSHTPFMSHILGEHGMTMITWDDSAGDWATNDPHLVAQRILDGVKPGSIILLHDGIDGNIGANRTVILQALPIILDGLKARGLQPVTLDRLLGKPGYVPC